MKKGTFRVQIWTGFEFDIIGTDICYFLGFFKGDIKLSPKTIETANGLFIRPGDVILRLGGKKTSAGFSTIWFDDENDGQDGKGLLYEGTYYGLDGGFLLFTQLREGKRVMPEREEYKLLYYAFKEMNPDRPDWGWFFTNQAGAGRIVETTHTILRKESYDGKISPQLY